MNSDSHSVNLHAGAYLLLYSCNIIVPGTARCAVYCLNKGEIYLAPKTFAKVVAKLERETYIRVRKEYSDQLEIFDAYVNFILKEKIGHFANNPNSFLPLKMQYNVPEDISSAIVDYDLKFDFQSLVRCLDKANCKYLQLILRSTVLRTVDLLSLLDDTFQSTIRNIDLILHSEQLSEPAFLDQIAGKYMKVSSITICGAKRDDQIFSNGVVVRFSHNGIEEYLAGSTIQDLLIVNHKYFTESHFYNPHFNKKVYIGPLGEIKNALSEKKVFGNVGTDDLLLVTGSAAFQRLWKEIPPQLKNSEFRYCLYNPSRKINVPAFSNCSVINRPALNEAARPFKQETQ